MTDPYQSFAAEFRRRSAARKAEEARGHFADLTPVVVPPLRPALYRLIAIVGGSERAVAWNIETAKDADLLGRIGLKKTMTVTQDGVNDEGESYFEVTTRYRVEQQ